MVSPGLSFTSFAWAAASFLRRSAYLSTGDTPGPSCTLHLPDEPVQITCNCEYTCEQEIRCVPPEGGEQNLLLGPACASIGFSAGILVGATCYCRRGEVTVAAAAAVTPDLTQIVIHGSHSSG